MKRILLVLNKANRELTIMNAIRRELVALAPDAVVRVLPYDGRFRGEVLGFRPDVMLTFPMTSIGLAQPYYVFKFLFGTKVACFRAEGIVDPASPQSVNNHVGYDRYGPTLVDYELFWGPGPARLIGEALIEKRKLSSAARIKCFGYPRLERYFGATPVEGLAPIPEQVAAKLSAFGRQRSVLLATGFHFANYTRETIFAARDLDAENRCDELLGIIEEVKTFRAGWMKAIRQTAAEHPDLLFVLKKHPIERKEDYAALDGVDNILYVWQDVDIGDLIEQSALFFHYGSTSLVDAYLAHIPAVYVHSDDARCRDWFPDLGWPSALSVSTEAIPDVVREFRAGAVIAEDSAAIRHVLEFNFNICPGANYRPSREIAAFLLSGEPVQRVPFSDPYLWLALARHCYLSLRRIVVRPVKKALQWAAGQSQ